MGEKLLEYRNVKVLIYGRNTFSLPEVSLVELKIYNTVGQLVRTLVAEDGMASGSHSVVWDGRDDEGRDVASGLYLYSLRAGDFTATKKMLLLR